MKTTQDYLNDPRIPGDPEMMAAPAPIREIHAIRLKRQDERAGMNTEAFNKKAETALSQRGISLCYDLAGQGRC
jgi:hypothetical protein